MATVSNVLHRMSEGALDYVMQDAGDGNDLMTKYDRNLGVIEMTSGSSGETRTMGDPRSAGQLVTLHHHTDGGGDITITFTSAYDQSGSTSMVFGDAGDNATFRSIEDGTDTYAWRLVGYDGVTGPTEELATVDVDTLIIGGTTVTATAAEINQAADESANTEVVTTTNVLTAAESGKTLILNSATAFVTTLPAVAAGLRFTFYAGATQVTGGNHTIVPNASNDNTIYGEYLVAGLTVPASAEGSINWVADTILPGDKVELFCDGTNWYVSGAAAATGAITFTT